MSSVFHDSITVTSKILKQSNLLKTAQIRLKSIANLGIGAGEKVLEDVGVGDNRVTTQPINPQL